MSYSSDFNSAPAARTATMTSQEERLAEALAVERVHGVHAGEFITSRVRELALGGDQAGVQRWKEIAKAYSVLNPLLRTSQ